MVTDETVEMYKRAYQEGEANFPKYYVSQPPHRDTLTPVYYKIHSPTGPVFWRREGDESGQTTTFFDLLLEEKSGFGINSVDKEYTPWAEK